MTRTTAVLLAAGAGTRLGRGPKALLPFRGSTLVNHVATELLRGGCERVVVVIGAGAPEVQATSLPPGCTVVANLRWREGMGTSLSVGIAAAGTAQVLIALVDQPGLDSRLVERLLASHKPGRITAPGYRSAHVAPGSGGCCVEHQEHDVPGAGALRRGNPVLFAPEHAARVAASATGDVGARGYLASHPESVDIVDCSDLTDGADLDTLAQLYLLEEPPSPLH